MSTVSRASQVRPYEPPDLDAVLELLGASLHWVPDDLFRRFFEWKHVENPFGRSPAWVAVTGSQVVGFRTFLRWEFEHPDGRIRRAARAVDTATHPEHQGRGIFRELTLHAIGGLRDDGVDFVFNTPNAKSRPGYLKMGWEEVGRLAATIRPRDLGALRRMLRARVPAERWSRRTSAGASAVDVLSDTRVDELLRSVPPPSGLRTRRTRSYLVWRYGFEPLAYRALTLDDDPRHGVAVFRIRRRGAATEAALCDVLVPGDDAAAGRLLERRVARATEADYVIRLDRRPVTRSGYVRIPRQGPVLTWRAVSPSEARPALHDFRLALGDVELF